MALKADLEAERAKRAKVEKEQEDLLVSLDELTGKQTRDKQRMKEQGMEDAPEIDCWSCLTRGSIFVLSNLAINLSTPETVNRVNHPITAWPMDHTLPAEGLEGIKANYKKPVSGLDDIKTQVDQDIE
jgi:hypothetical protein